MRYNVVEQTLAKIVAAASSSISTHPCKQAYTICLGVSARSSFPDNCCTPFLTPCVRLHQKKQFSLTTSSATVGTVIRPKWTPTAIAFSLGRAFVCVLLQNDFHSVCPARTISTHLRQHICKVESVEKLKSQQHGREGSSPKCHKCCILLLGLPVYITGVKMVESSTTSTSHKGKSYNCPANIRNTGPPAVSKTCALTDAGAGTLP